MKIYTRTGDAGESSLYNGKRLPKDREYFDALGDVDELNSAIGVAREFCDGAVEELAGQLECLQSRLLDVGSAIATPADGSSEAQRARAVFGSGHADQLEGWIDAMDEKLPPLTQFILPSGGKLSAFLHMARTICRRAERSVVPLVRDGHCESHVAVYLNRLSDYLFTAARFAAQAHGAPEVTYKKA